MWVMKIIITLEIEVDPKDWDIVYGTGVQPSKVRADVRDYVFNNVAESTGMEESDATVTIR